MQLTPQEVMWLSVLATAGLVLMWVTFWFAVTRSKESIRGILLSTAFFRTVVVMGVIASTTVLSLAGKVEGQVTGAILGGIVGYVLGHVSSRSQEKES